MLVVIRAPRSWRVTVERLRRFAESLGYRVVVLESDEFMVETPVGVYEDPDRASVALARLASWRGGTGA